MDNFDIITPNTNFMFEIIIASLLYILPLRRKENWLFIFIPLALLLYLVSLYLDTIIFNYSKGYPVVKSLITFKIIIVTEFLSIVFLFKFSCHISAFDSMYGAVCSYATQHTASSLTYILSATGLLEFSTGTNTVIYYSAYVFVYFLFYKFFAIKMVLDGKYDCDSKQSLLTMFLILFFAVGLSAVIKTNVSTENINIFVGSQLYAAMGCILILALQLRHQIRLRIQRKLDFETQMRIRQKEHFDLSKGNVELINMKCHDIKHQINALKNIRDENIFNKTILDLQESIMIYDSDIKTGNDILDMILNEKSPILKKNEISVTCMVDGTTLNSMDYIDVYTLFSNAIDNAIEASILIPDVEKRVISLSSHRCNDQIIYQIENYYACKLQIKNGLPETLKDKKYHGYGLKSIQSIVNKYSGSFVIDTSNSIFSLSIMLTA